MKLSKIILVFVVTLITVYEASCSSSVKPGDTFSGELKVYVIRSNGGKVVTNMPVADGVNSAIVYVLQLDEKVNICDYVESDELMYAPPAANSTDEIVIIMNDDNVDLRKYANRRVKVSGDIYFPVGGWRNYNGICLATESIRPTL